MQTSLAYYVYTFTGYRNIVALRTDNSDRVKGNWWWQRVSVAGYNYAINNDCSSTSEGPMPTNMFDVIATTQPTTQNNLHFFCWGGIINGKKTTPHHHHHNTTLGPITF